MRRRESKDWRMRNRKPLCYSLEELHMKLTYKGQIQNPISLAEEVLRKTEMMFLKYSYKWNRKHTSSRQFFIYLNYISSLKYNKGSTRWLSIRYFSYSTVTYVIYFSKNMPFLWSFLKLHLFYLLLCFWKYMS